MSECGVVREQIPLLLTESLDPVTRERAHLHIEECAECESEWQASKETWQLLGAIPDVEVPARVKTAFLAEINLPEPANVVPFRRRPVAKWIAQAATVAILTGGAFFAGRVNPVEPPVAPIAAATPAPAFTIAENSVIPASNINPDIQGRPQIRNVRFFPADEANGGGMGVSFELTSQVTVTGDANDANLVKLVSNFLRKNEYSTVARSNAIQWVRDQYQQEGSTPAPELVSALASIVRNDEHEGVRINALDALKTLPAVNAPEAQEALISALKNDPNPAVRIKAVEALAEMATRGKSVDPATIDTLREKASQNDENSYVRVKAAEALSQLSL